MKLLRVIATLDARHGGPAAGLRAITPALAALGHRSDFVSLDAPGAGGVVPGASAHYELGPARGGYAYSSQLVPWLRRHAAGYHAVFVHGLWQYPGRAVWSVLRQGSPPYFVFPHGMLDPWFRRAYPAKHLKKSLYWRLFEHRVLRDAAAVLFTCEEERRLARASFRPYACRERVVAYGTASPQGDPETQIAAWHAVEPALRSRPYWLFLGRLHPKKGVDLLLEGYRQRAAEAVAPLPALVVAGPCSDPEYRKSLEGIVANLPPAGRVVWAGMIEGDRKWGALRGAEAFILPSHQENFGIAVVEAMAVGTPVLITRQVNIWSEIESAGAGLACADDGDGVRELLRRWQTMSEQDRVRMRDAARALFATKYEIGRVAQSLVAHVSEFLPASPALIP